MVLSPDLVARVDAVFADVDKPGHPDAGLIVIDHDEILYRRCYGLADLETRRPITPRYVAHVGGCVAYFNYIIRLLDTQRTILILTN